MTTGLVILGERCNFCPRLQSLIEHGVKNRLLVINLTEFKYKSKPLFLAYLNVTQERRTSSSVSYITTSQASD